MKLYKYMFHKKISLHTPFYIDALGDVWVRKGEYILSELKPDDHAHEYISSASIEEINLYNKCKLAEKIKKHC